MKSYLIIDIGTGNVRVAVVATDGHIVWVGRDNMVYHKDDKYKEALYFDPGFLWKQIVRLVRQGLAENPEVDLVAATASSQREGIVLVDKGGSGFIGFPNHDHRGRNMEDLVKDKDAVYTLTGRYPTSLFSALKLVAYRDKYPEEWRRTACFMSISDWAQYQLSGVRAYEHAQASETLLYDVRQKKWSDELLAIFSIPKKLVPPLQFSGTELGQMTENAAKQLGLQQVVPVLVGGADTQLAIKSTRPDPGDVVLVSGTTTPVVQVVENYILDEKQRSWTNSHLDKAAYILETNCGVTGLNYQRIKSIFYPNDSYAIIEEEIDGLKACSCFAHLGSLIAGDKEVITQGGFLFEVPIMTELSRADFAFAALWDIACSIKENLDCLKDIHPVEKNYLWCCGGGFQSRHLREYVAGLTGKRLVLRSGYQQASVSGAAVVCSEYIQNEESLDSTKEIIEPLNEDKYLVWYKKWQENRNLLKNWKR